MSDFCFRLLSTNGGSFAPPVDMPSTAAAIAL
jgi:hypothetical protein